MIEPLSVIQPDRKKPEYLVLDGHLRVLALKELGMSVGPCLFAKDDESYSYNHHINRLSTIAEHYMIRRAIDRGVSKERLARAFNVNLSSINRRINLLEGICPEAITLLQDKQFTPDVTRILRNMKAARQVEAVELMIASNTITMAHAEALLKATPPEQRTDVKPAEREKKAAPIEQIEKLEREMNQVQEKYQEAESSYGSDLLNLVVAKGYLTKLLANGAVKSYIGRHEPEILTHLELVVNTVSMEEAVQQQQAETAEATQEVATPGL
jgi:ParB-like chromosome segregation protein Spo0J